MSHEFSAPFYENTELKRGSSKKALPEIDLSHELELENPVVESFKAAGLPLNAKLQDMLEETLEYRWSKGKVGSFNIRRGGGYMNAGRFLADAFLKNKNSKIHYLFALKKIKQACLEKTPGFESLANEMRNRIADARTKVEMARRNVESAKKAVIRATEILEKQPLEDFDNPRTITKAYKVEMLRRELMEKQYEFECAVSDIEYIYDEAFPEGMPDLTSELHTEINERLAKAISGLHNEEDVVVGNMIQDLIHPTESQAIHLPAEADYAPMRAGSCTTAERYFLEHGQYGKPKVIVDKNGDPVMLYKSAGDPSGMTLTETVLNGVRLPPGSLVSLNPPEGKRSEKILQLDECKDFKFLRLTTLAISPKNRRRAFGSALVFQEYQNFQNADTASVQDFRELANIIILKNKTNPSTSANPFETS